MSAVHAQQGRIFLSLLKQSAPDVSCEHVSVETLPPSFLDGRPRVNGVSSCVSHSRVSLFCSSPGCTTLKSCPRRTWSSSSLMRNSPACPATPSR